MLRWLRLSLTSEFWGVSAGHCTRLYWTPTTPHRWLEICKWWQHSALQHHVSVLTIRATLHVLMHAVLLCEPYTGQSQHETVMSHLVEGRVGQVDVAHVPTAPPLVGVCVVGVVAGARICLQCEQSERAVTRH